MIPHTPYFFDTSWFPVAHIAITVMVGSARTLRGQYEGPTYGCPGTACRRSRSFWNRNGWVGMKRERKYQRREERRIKMREDGEESGRAARAREDTNGQRTS